MNALPRFPDLPGLGWPVRRTPVGGSTRSRQTVSGRRAVLSLWQNPLFEFELSFEALTSSDQRLGLYARSKQMLEGFFLQQQGSYGTFVFVDKTDSQQLGAALGIGDNTTSTFVATRMIGSYQGPADYVLNVDTVYANGVALDPSTWTLVLPNQIVFSTPPAAETVLSLDFWWGYICTFAEDKMTMDQFMTDVWELKSLRLVSVRAS